MIKVSIDLSYARMEYGKK